MKSINILRIFLASPSDVKDEREMLFALKNDLDLIIGKDKNIMFEIINWEKNTYPGKGVDAQDVINKQINDDYDIFLGIFWQRFGTPTNRYESGTVEEYENAKRKFDKDRDNTHILMYFKNQEADMYSVDLEQFKKVKEFKDRISKEDGIYYQMFEKTEDLKNLVLLNLSNLIRDKFIDNDKSSSQHLLMKNEIPTHNNYDKYELLAKKIDDGNYNIENEYIIEYVEKTSGFLYDLTSSTNKITNAMSFFTHKTEEKTNQLNRVNHIKDEKLKKNKIAEISNSYAIDLDKYSEDLETILPEFQHSISNIIESYSEIILKTISSGTQNDNIKNEVISNIPQFITSIEKAIDGTASLLESFISNQIQLTSKFRFAKRRAELATNNIFKELINARNLLKLLDSDYN